MGVDCFGPCLEAEEAKPGECYDCEKKKKPASKQGFAKEKPHEKK